MTANYEGNVTDKIPRWKFQPAQADGKGMSYAAFEGYYPDRGGKLYSLPIPLLKSPSESIYFRLSFTGKTQGTGYAGVELFGDDGLIQVQPDNNDGVCGNTAKRYEIMIHAEPQTTQASIFFMSKDGIEVADVTLRKMSPTEIAQANDELYATMPPLNYCPAQTAAELLPRTAEAIKTGKPWRVVMLGDSIVNDTYNSCFGALIQRDYPQSKLEIVCSVRGSTGCWYYQEEANFKKYVADNKPDLLIIGGISNVQKDPAAGLFGIEKVIKMAREKLGCEILLLSPGYSFDTRLFDEKNPTAPIPPSKWAPANASQKFMAQEQELARQLRVPFLDTTTPAYEYIYASGKPFNYFNRDKIHSNVMGKQINGRILQRFLTSR